MESFRGEITLNLSKKQAVYFAVNIPVHPRLLSSHPPQCLHHKTTPCCNVFASLLIFLPAWLWVSRVTLLASVDFVIDAENDKSENITNYHCATF